MTASASRILSDSTDLIALTESNQRFAGLTSDQRFWYRMAMLDVTSMLANDLMPCEDVDTESVGACLEAIHEWCSQLHTLSDNIEAVKESIEFDRKQEYELNGFQSCIKDLMSLSAIK